MRLEKWIEKNKPMQEEITDKVMKKIEEEAGSDNGKIAQKIETNESNEEIKVGSNKEIKVEKTEEIKVEKTEELKVDHHKEHKEREHYGHRGKRHKEYETEKSEDHKSGGHQKQKKEGAGGFTHFLSAPLNMKTLQDSYLSWKAGLMKMQPYHKGLFSSEKILHITLLMLPLSDPEKLKAAKELMRSSEPVIKKILDGKGIDITLKGLGAFMNRHNVKDTKVVYCNIEVDEGLERLKKVQDYLIKQLLEQNIVQKSDFSHIVLNPKTNGYECGEYHLTLMNSTFSAYKKQARKNTFDATFVLDMGKDLPFGTHKLESIDLSTRFSFDETGFYTPAHRIKLNN